jgi:hypothetical protein
MLRSWCWPSGTGPARSRPWTAGTSASSGRSTAVTSKCSRGWVDAGGGTCHPGRGFSAPSRGTGPSRARRRAFRPLNGPISTKIFDTDPDDCDHAGRAFLEPILDDLGLPIKAVGALGDASSDLEPQRETDEALALPAKGVGTPIIQCEPPGGVAFLGPVIRRLPDRGGALHMHVIGLASFPGFAEFTRSLRERPQLRSFGVVADQVGVQEGWHGGSRPQKR